MRDGMGAPIVRHADHLPRRQPRGTSGIGAALQWGQSAGAGSQLLGPLADGHPADTRTTSDLGLCEMAGSKQPARFELSPFELFGSEFFWSPRAYDHKTG